MLTINKLPISAGMTRLISQIVKEAAKIPMVLLLKSSSTWMLAPHLNPNSVRKVNVGTTAMIRNTTLMPPQTWPNPNQTLKTGKTRLY